MRNPIQTTERSLLKIGLGVLAIVVLLIVLSAAALRYSRGWQQRHLMTQANEFFAKGDYQRASLNARRLIQLNDFNVEACRMMAKLSERAGLRTAIDWRRRVVDLIGPQPEDTLALAKTALSHRELMIAESALGKIPKEARNNAEYHSVAADLAAARKKPVEVEQHLVEAARLAPANNSYAFRLGTLQLSSDDSVASERGRKTLVALQKDATLGRDATRQLIIDALHQFDFPRARALIQELLTPPEATFRDRLVALEVLHRTSDPGFNSFFDQLGIEAAANPANIGDFLNWMNSHRMARDATEWSKELSPVVLKQRAVALAVADSYVMIRDWEGLQRVLKGASWGDLDFIHSALSARALREQGHQLQSQGEWSAAVKKARAGTETLLVLAETAQSWGWHDEAIELLWLASKDPLRGLEALQSLYAHFSKNRDTPNIYRALLHLREFRPEDLDIQNNVVQLSLLLNLDTDRAQRLARDLYEKEPSNPAYASTYAFALYLKGENRKATQVLSALPVEEVRRPAVAAYYGITLAAVGERQRAAEFLDLGKTASLLPEEVALVEKARRSLRQL